jgi:hypothetical protein
MDEQLAASQEGLSSISKYVSDVHDLKVTTENCLFQKGGGASDSRSFPVNSQAPFSSDCNLSNEFVRSHKLSLSLYSDIN